MRIARVVLATDFTGAARAALDHAVAIASRSGARLYLFHVVDVRRGESGPAPATGSGIDEFYDLAERRARDARRESAPAAISIVECVRIGEAADEVVSFATDKGADLIVVGTRGRTGLRRLLAGSVAESVMRRAPCPVLAVRVPEEAGPAGAGEGTVPAAGLSRALAALDASASSRAALRVARDLTRETGGRVTALSVVDDQVLARAATLSHLDVAALASSLTEVARTSLERLVRETLGAATAREVDLRVEHGRSAETIVRVAAEVHADLVACGTHGRSGLRRALFGSVAEQVVRRAPCPVLVVREGTLSARRAAA